MGYEVDPILSAAMSQIRKKAEKRIESTLAWLNATPDPAPFRNNPTFRLVWDEVTKQAQEMGYLIEPFWLYDPGISPARLARILKARGIEGILVLQYYHRVNSGAPPPVDFDFGEFACVSVTTRLTSPDINFVQADHFACAEIALQEMRALGYRRIGLVCPPSIDTLTQRRIYAAYEGFLVHHPEMIRIPTFVDESETKNKALRAWLKKQKPDAVLTWILPEEFRAMGYDVPGQLGVCMLDVFPEFGDCAGVCQNHREIGAAAVRQLTAQLQQGLRGVPQIATAVMVEGHWVPGSSLSSRPPKKR